MQRSELSTLDRIRFRVAIFTLGSPNDRPLRRRLAWLLRKIFFKRTRFAAELVTPTKIYVGGEQRTVGRVVNETTLELGEQ